MIYFLIVFVAVIEIVYLFVNRPIFVNIPAIQFYMFPLIVVILLSIFLSKRTKRMMRVVKQVSITAAIFIIIFVPVVYTGNLPLYSYSEAKAIIAKREKLLLTEFEEHKNVHKDEENHYYYLYKVIRDEETTIQYIFDPFTGGYEALNE